MISGDIDLNLLRVLDALLDAGSVAGAAERLHLSPPAVSRSLGRLRKVFGDPLFVRAGRTLVPTELAKSLRGPAREALEVALRVLAPTVPTSPAEIHRRFAIRADDAIVAVLALPLMESVRADAPGVDIDFLPEAPDTVTRLRAGELDLRLGVHAQTHHDTPSEVVVTDRFVAALRRDHPLLDGNLSPQRFAEAAHVTVSSRAQRRGPIDDALGELGLSRDHVTTVTSFVVAAHLVATTDLVGSMPRAVVETLTPVLPIVAVEIPVALPDFDVHMTWHDRSTTDPVHAWLRDRVRAVVERWAAVP